LPTLRSFVRSSRVFLTFPYEAMAIPAALEGAAEQRACFAPLRQEFDRLRETLPTLDTLSIGMSGDYGAAIAEGSTMVRIGTALFGARPS